MNLAQSYNVFYKMRCQSLSARVHHVTHETKTCHKFWLQQQQ